MIYWIPKTRLTDNHLIVIHNGPDCPVAKGTILVQSEIPPRRSAKKCNYCFG